MEEYKKQEKTVFNGMKMEVHMSKLRNEKINVEILKHRGKKIGLVQLITQLFHKILLGGQNIQRNEIRARHNSVYKRKSKELPKLLQNMYCKFTYEKFKKTW